jgi:hypothetical protein
MADYDNTNRGALFKNTRKENEKHSDYNGSINVDGHDYWLNAWLQTSKDGKTFMSLSVKRKDGTAERPEQFAKKAQEVFPGAQIDDDGDGIPF